MRLLLIGGTGFIGSALARALSADGHDLRILARDIGHGRRMVPDADWRHGDLNMMTRPADWSAYLIGVEAVINASGLLQGGSGDTVQAIQSDAIIAMASAAQAAGVARIIQISAAGADANPTDFMTTKLIADAALMHGPVPTLVLRPGLVIGRNAYGGTELIRMAAAMPIRMTPRLGGSIHCIALDDVVDAVRIGLTQRQVPAHPVDLVGREAHSLVAIIDAHRRWLALPPSRWSLIIPPWLMAVVTFAADLLGHLRWRSPLRSNAVAALERGVDGDTAMTADWLGREPLSLEQTLGRMAAGKQDRIAAAVNLLMPIALLALIMMWGASGIATLVHLQDATSMIVAGGVDPMVARILAAGGALVDLLLAVALLWRPTARLALLAMVAMTATYLLLGSALLPQLWVDPLAPLAKALPPLVLALILLPVMDKR